VAVSIQIKDVPEEVRDAIAARAAARGQSTQVYLRALLEREFRAERNRHLFESLIEHRGLGLTADEVVDDIRAGREEREALYDANGRQLPTKLASEYRKKGSLRPADLTVDGVTYQEPFVGVDRERDMELTHKHFSAIMARTDE
jgi:hypothetical protein